MRLLATLWIVLAGCTDVADRPRILGYTRTFGYRHADAIEAASTQLAAALEAEGVALDLSEDSAVFTTDGLSTYQAIAFLYTSGNDILDAEGKRAMEAFIRAGGGWFGLHSASDTEYAWPFYQELVVSAFDSHPAVQLATLTVEGPLHPAMVRLPAGPWPASDEWYNFRDNPRTTSGVEILATVDEATYSGGTMGPDHPLIWAHTRLGGRALYSGLGHVAEAWQDPTFVEHVVDGLRWVAVPGE